MTEEQDKKRRGAGGRDPLARASGGARARGHCIATSANLALATAALAFGGGPGPALAAGSEQQARICRSILLVLNPAKSRITMEQSRVVGFDDGVTLLYEVEVPGERKRSRRVTCAFAQRRGAPPELIAVSSDGRTLGPARLTFLKRFWVGSVDAARADGSIADKRRAP